MHTFDKLYIGGEWVPSDGTATIDVIDASTEEVMGRDPRGNRGRRRPRRGRGASPPSTPGPPPSAEERAELRGTHRRRARRARRRRSPRRSPREVGMPLKLSRADPGRSCPAVTCGRSPAWLARASRGRSRSATRWCVQEPVGVVGCITPWNYPLHQSCARSRRRSPSAAPSCSSPARSRRSPPSSWPRSSTPSSLPPGVFNLVTGDGPGRRRGARGAPRRRHGELHRLDARRQARGRARRRTVKHVALELGGKSREP